ncbi:MAG: hypothetical protein PUH03_03800 [bacterium]|nr:hypothetical protein [bacterium]
MASLSDKGVDAEVLGSSRYWSSSESSATNALALYSNTGSLSDSSKYTGKFSIRCSLILKNIFLGNGTAPKIGDVMYEDKSYGEAADYDGSKTPVGIIASVSREKQDVMIINLKDLTFSSDHFLENFDPENPYGKSVKGIWWSRTYSTDITKIPNFNITDVRDLAKASDNCPCQLYKPTCTLNAATCAAESKIFNDLICACEDCPSGYLFDSEVNECRKTCSKGISGCSKYDSEWADCKCTACEDGFDGYLFEGSCRENYCHTYGDMCKVDYCKQCASETECAVCARGFTLKNNKCVYSADECVPGMVLYDDFNCYDPDNFPSDRTPIGIIFRASNVNTGRLLALSLDEVTLPWSENLANTETGCNSRTDGQANTDCIIAAGAEENSAAVYCSKYGVTDSDKGKWYLPAAAEVLSMIGQGHPMVCLFDASALKFGSKTVLGGNNFHIGDLATSTEDSSTYFVAIQRGTAGFQLNKKSAQKHIRCVIDYSNSSDCPIIEHCGSYQDDCSCRWCSSSTYGVEYELSDDGLSCIAQ